MKIVQNAKGRDKIIEISGKPFDLPIIKRMTVILGGVHKCMNQEGVRGGESPNSNTEEVIRRIQPDLQVKPVNRISTQSLQRIEQDWHVLSMMDEPMD